MSLRVENGIFYSIFLGFFCRATRNLRTWTHTENTLMFPSFIKQSIPLLFHRWYEVILSSFPYRSCCQIRDQKRYWTLERNHCVFSASQASSKRNTDGEGLAWLLHSYLSWNYTLSPKRGARFIFFGIWAHKIQRPTTTTQRNANRQLQSTKTSRNDKHKKHVLFIPATRFCVRSSARLWKPRNGKGKAHWLPGQRIDQLSCTTCPWNARACPTYRERV